MSKLRFGFSLLEVAVVMVIIGIILPMIFYFMQGVIGVSTQMRAQIPATIERLHAYTIIHEDFLQAAVPKHIYDQWQAYKKTYKKKSEKKETPLSLFTLRELPEEGMLLAFFTHNSLAAYEDTIAPESVQVVYRVKRESQKGEHVEYSLSRFESKRFGKIEEVLKEGRELRILHRCLRIDIKALVQAFVAFDEGQDKNSSAPSSMTVWEIKKMWLEYGLLLPNMIVLTVKLQDPLVEEQHIFSLPASSYYTSLAYKYVQEGLKKNPKAATTTSRNIAGMPAEERVHLP